MKKFFYVFLIALLVDSFSASGQDLTMNYMSYVYNLYNINPAYCAMGHKFYGIADIRHRAGLDATNAMIGAYGDMGSRQGIGGRLNADNRGPFQVIVLDLTYGYHVSLNEYSNLYAGLSAGFNNKSINTSKINGFSDAQQDDPVLNPANFKSTAFTAGAGLIYEYKTLELAVSAPQLLAFNQHSANYINVFAANIFHLNDAVSLTPMLFYFNNPVVKNLFSGQAKVDLHKKFWFQLGVESNSLLNAGVGLHLGDITFGYSYTTSNNLTQVQTSGMHEVVFNIKLGNKKIAPYINKRDKKEHVE